MHIAIRAAGFSLMTMFVSCGVGAQQMDSRIGKVAMKVTMDAELPAYSSAGNSTPSQPWNDAYDFNKDAR